MSAVRYPIRYRRVPLRRQEFAELHAECAALLERATELDAAQRALSGELAEVRTQLAQLRLVMWPRVDRHEIVHGFRVTLRGGPPPMPLVEVHRELHLNGYAIASRLPVQRLADALAYEITKGRAVRVDRGVYRIGQLNPGEFRRLSRLPRPAPAATQAAA
jgi:hypothetical protein